VKLELPPFYAGFWIQAVNGGPAEYITLLSTLQEVLYDGVGIQWNYSMPRKARLGVPGALHHIMIRGINRSAIFKDDQDKVQSAESAGVGPSQDPQFPQ
jgi:hypothetical protein